MSAIKSKSSIDLYKNLKKNFERSNQFRKSDMEQLFDLIKQELITSGCSSLIDAAYFSCQCFFLRWNAPIYEFKPTSFIVSNSSKHMKIPAFGAWHIIIFLSEYLTAGTITENAEKYLPYIFGNHALTNISLDNFYEELQRIDDEICKHKNMECSSYPSGFNPAFAGLSSRDSVPVAVRKQTEDYSTAVTTNTEKKEKVILDSARKQAEKERQKIIDAARKEAERIIQRASFEAEKKVSIARNKQVELTEASRKQSAIEEQQQLQHHFSEVRSTLLEVNTMIKNLEDTVSESSIRKISDQLLELFNLIADVKDSTVNLARKNHDQNLENAAYNMDVFLDMIIGYMADHGIQAIASTPGTQFSPKHHTIGIGSQPFDPHSASIKASKRTGFLWGEQVLQKEQVEI